MAFIILLEGPLISKTIVKISHICFYYSITLFISVLKLAFFEYLIYH